jgi:hypothetical protein
MAWGAAGAVALLSLIFLILYLAQPYRPAPPPAPAAAASSYLNTPATLYSGPGGGNYVATLAQGQPVNMTCWTDSAGTRWFYVTTGTASGYVVAPAVSSQTVVPECNNYYTNGE